MSWTRLDDQWDIGTKLLRAAELLKSDAPHAMWARGVTHCNREHTDGRIHGAVLRSKTYHRKPQAVVDALVAVGALHDLGGDSYEIHDFLDWNDSKAQVEDKRRSKQENGRKGGKRSGEVRQPQDEPKAKQRGSELEATASDSLRVRLKQNEPLSSPLLSSGISTETTTPPSQPETPTGGGVGGYEIRRELVRRELDHPTFAFIRELGTIDATVEAVVSVTERWPLADVGAAVRSIASKAAIEGWSHTRIGGALAAANRFAPKPGRASAESPPPTESNVEVFDEAKRKAVGQRQIEESKRMLSGGKAGW